jgi:hypothetical protein
MVPVVADQAEDFLVVVEAVVAEVAAVVVEEQDRSF